MLSLGVLLIIGIGIVGGAAGGALFKRMKIPQVLGYISAGLLIGNTGIGLVSLEDVESLRTFNMFALGVIGFLVGSEIHISTFKKYGKQLSLILIGEGVLAFVLTGVSTGLALYFVTDSVSIAVAGGVVLGAIASATDPASTINVLWEYRTAGIFTTTLIAVVALDDVLAMTLYGFGTGLAQVISGSGDGSLVVCELLKVVYELGGSVVIGGLTGLSLAQIFRRASNYDNATAVSSGILLFVVGVGITFDFDIIIISMASAITFVNIEPLRSKKFIDYIKGVAIPVYIFFFVLIGARINFSSMPLWVWSIIGLYVFFRTVGKFVGAKIGANLSNSHISVKKYVGMGLFSQGGVAIGLSILAAHHLENIEVSEGLSLGSLIVSVVAMTTFLVQIIGPAAVKFAARKSGEAGRCVTENDLISQHSLSEFVLKDEIAKVVEGTSAKEIINIFSKSDLDAVSVVDSENKMIGFIDMYDMRTTLAEPGVWEWLISADIMSEQYHKILDTDTLASAFQLCEQLQVDQVSVCDKDSHYVGYFDRYNGLKRIKSEIVSMGM